MIFDVIELMQLNTTLKCNLFLWGKIRKAHFSVCYTQQHCCLYLKMLTENIVENIEFDGGVGETAGRVGVVTLATDQTIGIIIILDIDLIVAWEHDMCTVLLPLGVGVFFSRVEMDDTVTPDTLRDMTTRIGETARLAAMSALAFKTLFCSQINSTKQNSECSCIWMHFSRGYYRRTNNIWSTFQKRGELHVYGDGFSKFVLRQMPSKQRQ